MAGGSARGATLVTGAGGCIGAWIVRQLVAAGQPVVAFDLRADARRLGLLLDVYNLTNSKAAQNINWGSGASFERPISIVGPTIVRFGVKFDW